MVAKLRILEHMGNTELANLNQQADEIVSEILNSDVFDESKYYELQELVSKMSGATITSTVESIGFERALANMDFASIDFTNADAVKNAINDVVSKADAAQQTLEDTINSSILQYETMRAQYVSWGLDVKLDEKFGVGTFDTLFSDLNTITESGLQQEIDKIENAKNLFLAMVQAQKDANVEEAILSTEYTWGDYVGANWGRMIAAGVSPLTWGKTLDPKTNYQAMREQHVQTITDQFSDIQDVLDEATKGVDLSPYYDIGKDIVLGMANGTLGTSDKVYSALDELSKNAIDRTKGNFDTHSPSKVFAGIGGNLMLGLRDGIARNQSIVLAVIDESALEIIDRMKKMHDEISKYSIENLLAEDFTPDLGTVDYSAFEKAARTIIPVGVIREAYSEDIFGNFSRSEQFEAEANITIYNQIDMDNETVAENVNNYNARLAFRNNGR